MGLLELIRHEKELRRIFGQQELKIIEKQLLGVNLSPSEKTRLSRDIKPKFEIIKEGEESFVILDEKYKLNLKAINYQKNHKEILQSFQHFDVTTFEELRSIFYSFELE